MANTYLTRTVGTPSSNQKFTISTWVKRTGVGSDTNICGSDAVSSQATQIYFKSDDTFRIFDSNSSTDLVTNRKFRDSNAWYHIVVAVDTSLGTASDRIKLYVNGVQETSFGTSNYSSQNNGWIMASSGSKFYIGVSENTGGAKFGYMDGVLSHFHFVDNQQYNASVFGSTDSTTGEWKINTSPTMTMGNMGFTVLKDGMTITDQSSNSNDFTLGGGTLTKTEDNPSNVFATLNPLFYSADITLSNGNTKAVEASNNWRSAYSNIGHSTGKFYAEAKITYQSGNEGYIGVAHEDHMNGTATYGGSTSGPNSGGYDYIGYSNKSVGIYSNGQDHYPSTVQKTASFQSSGDIIGIAVDIPGNKFYLSKNGQWNNAAGNAWDSTTFDASIGAISWTSKWTSGQVFVGCSPNESTWEWNFGNGYFGTTAVSSAGTNASGIGIFEYDVPSGFTAWSTKGLNE